MVTKGSLFAVLLLASVSLTCSPSGESRGSPPEPAATETAAPARQSEEPSAVASSTPPPAAEPTATATEAPAATPTAAALTLTFERQLTAGEFPNAPDDQAAYLVRVEGIDVFQIDPSWLDPGDFARSLQWPGVLAVLFSPQLPSGPRTVTLTLPDGRQSPDPTIEHVGAAPTGPVKTPNPSPAATLELTPAATPRAVATATPTPKPRECDP